MPATSSRRRPPGRIGLSHRSFATAGRSRVVVHARGAVAEDDLAREIGSAARLAVDNERLQAELLARLHDLQASRTRIVETGDGVRRLLERNLHDGAQQRLLALAYDLRVARSAAQAAGEDELAVALEGAQDEAQAALEELRELAHGIFPAILTEAGLGPALWGLVDQAPFPVELTEPGGERYSPAVETAAYVVADDAIADASRRDATHALVRVERSGTNLVVEIEDDGSEADTVPLHLVGSSRRTRWPDRARRRRAARGAPVRVVVAEDTMLTREGIVRLLEEANVEVCRPG